MLAVSDTYTETNKRAYNPENVFDAVNRDLAEAEEKQDLFLFVSESVASEAESF